MISMGGGIMNELIEKLSDLEHEQWSHLIKYLDGFKDSSELFAYFTKCRLQAHTSYQDLSEEDKEKDRIFARRSLNIFFEILDSIEPKVRGYVAERVFETMQGSKDHISVEEILERFRDEVKKIKADNPTQNVSKQSNTKIGGGGE